MEILFTGLHSLQNENHKLTGNTSIWMFPIYGMASFLSPICRRLKGKSLVLRGGVYTCCIFIGEYITGSFLRKFEACPWDYSEARLNINGLIRLDYAPVSYTHLDVYKRQNLSNDIVQILELVLIDFYHPKALVIILIQNRLDGG